MPRYIYIVDNGKQKVKRHSWRAVSLFLENEGVNLVSLPNEWRRKKVGVLTRDGVTIHRIPKRSSSQNLRLFLPVQLNMIQANTSEDELHRRK